jgi:Cu(I)/Ag(I) efflux system membrane fusion protein
MKTLILPLTAALLLTACTGGAPEPGQDMAAMATGARQAASRLPVAVAESRDLVREVRLAGRVVPAETGMHVVTARVDGYVERLLVDYTGRSVRAGEPLLELYSPELVAAQEELLLALRLRAALAAGDAAQNADSLVAAARRRLLLWDIGEDQIAAIEKTGAVRRTLTLRAPANGTVLEKSVVQGQSVMAGSALFRIADLSHLWLEADVFESDLAVVRTGQHATVEVDALPGETLHGTVSFVYPTVDPQARTGRVRLELGDARLRPGMFARAVVQASLGRRGVVVPRQAALVTGVRALVFVLDSAGRPTPREVTLGAALDSVIEVRRGLAAGERVIAAAAFLLDAEQNLDAAMAGMAGMSHGAGGAPPAPRAAPAARESMPAMPGMGTQKGGESAAPHH